MSDSFKPVSGSVLLQIDDESFLKFYDESNDEISQLLAQRQKSYGEKYGKDRRDGAMFLGLLAKVIARMIMGFPDPIRHSTMEQIKHYVLAFEELDELEKEMKEKK